MKGETGESIEAQAKKEGMMTMIEDGIFKAAQGRNHDRGSLKGGNRIKLHINLPKFTYKSIEVIGEKLTKQFVSQRTNSRFTEK